MITRSLTRPLTRAITRALTRAITAPGTGGYASIMGDTLAPYVTFTRASTATYFDSAGVMQTAGINEPRYDYDPDTLAYRGLLVEEQRTNLLTYSADFSNAAWPTWDYVITANDIAAPDGTTTADKITATATPAALTRAFTATSTSHAFSIYIKYGTTPASSNDIAIRNNTTATILASMSFAGAQIISSNSIRETLSDGWYRITVWATTGITVGDNLGLYFGATGAITDGQYWYVWGGQLEAGSFATSYIPTTSAAVTRAADTAVVSDLTDIGYNASEGTLYVEGYTAPGIGASNISLVSVNDNTANELIALRHLSGGTTHDFAVVDGGVTQVDTAGVSVTASSAIKAAIAWKANDFAQSVNGGAAQTDATGTIPTVDRLTFGAFNGRLKTLRYYPRRLSNAELQELTA